MARRLRSIGVMAIITLMALFTLLPVAGAAPRAATQTVNAKDFEFDPKSITINVGDTITWKNAGAAPHTAQADDGSFNSGNLAAGAEYSFTFNTAGTFPYFCLYHGAAGGAGMSGTVVVQEAAAAQPTAAPAAATPTGSVDVSDQPLAEGGITVAKVTAGQDGWIVAHLDEADKPGKVLGQTAVKAGDNNNVKIALSESVPVGGKLWPMLHIDAGAVGTYEFPGPDAPVIIGGNIIMKQISVTAGGPATLPRTGSAETSAGLLLAALALLAAGALLIPWARRRA